MSEKRFEVVLNEFDEVEYIMDKKLCEDKNFAEFMDFVEELAKENEQLKQKIERWKNLYELKDSEVTARVNGLNKVCEYYTSEVLFKSDTDPNQAVKEVINEILNTEVKK